MALKKRPSSRLEIDAKRVPCSPDSPPDDGTCCFDWLPVEIQHSILRSAVLENPTRTTFMALRGTCNLWRDITNDETLRNAFLLGHLAQGAGAVSFLMLFIFFPMSRVFQVLSDTVFMQQHYSQNKIFDIRRKFTIVCPLFCTEEIQKKMMLLHMNPLPTMMMTWKQRAHPMANYARAMDHIIGTYDCATMISTLRYMEDRSSRRDFPFDEWRIATIERAFSRCTVSPTRDFADAVHRLAQRVQPLSAENALRMIEKIPSHSHVEYDRIFQALLGAGKMPLDSRDVCRAIFKWYWKTTFMAVKMQLPELVRRYGLITLDEAGDFFKEGETRSRNSTRIAEVMCALNQHNG